MHEKTASSPSSLAISILMLALVLLALAVLEYRLWSLSKSPSQRQTARSGLLRLSARAMRKLARRTAAASMRRELDTDGQLRDYAIPYWLASKADRLDRAAERLAA